MSARLIGFFLCMLLPLYSCKSFDPSLFLNKKPEAKLKKVDIGSISLRDVTLLFDVAVKNPYPIGLNLEGLKFDFFVENNQLFKSKTTGGLKVKAKAEEVTQLAVNIKYLDIEKIVRDYLNKDYLNCEIKGAIIVKLPSVGIPGVPSNWSFPFTLKKKIPAIKPEIKIKNFKVEQPSMAEIKRSLEKLGKQSINPSNVSGMFKDLFSGKPKDAVKRVVDPSELDIKITVNFDIVMENKTRAKMNFKSLNYNFHINSENLIDGKTNDIKSQGNTSILRVQNQFSSKALSKSVLKAFQDRKAQFNLKGVTYLNLPSTIKKEPLKLEFDEAGQFTF